MDLLIFLMRIQLYFSIGLVEVQQLVIHILQQQLTRLSVLLGFLLPHRLFYLVLLLLDFGEVWLVYIEVYVYYDFQLDFGGCTLGLSDFTLFNFYTQAIFLLIVFVDIWLWLVTCYQWVYSRSYIFYLNQFLHKSWWLVTMSHADTEASNLMMSDTL